MPAVVNPSESSDAILPMPSDAAVESDNKPLPAIPLTESVK